MKTNIQLKFRPSVVVGNRGTICYQIQYDNISHQFASPYRVNVNEWDVRARDMFLFSFYTRGMSFIDMAYLKKTDLRNGVLSYRRSKTGQTLSVQWESCMQQILDHYPSRGDSEYLFPIIRHSLSDKRRQYKNSLARINRNLKELGRVIGLSAPLTMYVARHSWASIAHSEGIPLSVISEGMGHDNEKTTQIYLASLEHSVVDKANRKILKLV